MLWATNSRRVSAAPDVPPRPTPQGATDMSRDTSAERRRSTAIDVLKASAIVTVIWIHAFLPWWRPHVGVFRWLGSLSRFAVPTFFFAAGFLYLQSAPMDGKLVWRRLRRLLSPYVVASLIAVAAQAAYLRTVTWQEAIRELLLGDAVGVYYFVPPFAGAVLLAALVARWRSLERPLFALFWVTGLLCELGVISVGHSWFWDARDPLRWWGYFLAGWLMAGQVDTVRAWGVGVRRRLGGALFGIVLALCVVAAWVSPAGQGPTWMALEYLRLYAFVFGVFLLAFDARECGAVRWLSTATYPIYLYHFFFIGVYRELFVVYGFAPLLGAPGRDEFVLALAGGVLTVWLGRLAFGDYAKLVIG